MQSIKEQIESLNSEVNSILTDEESLNPDALMNIADAVKDIVEVPASEMAALNTKIISTPIENSQEVLQEAVGAVSDLKVLLQNCHGILNQVYAQIASLDISDPKMIEAVAAFVSSMKDTIQSFIDLYRDEQSFVHTVFLKKMDFEHKKALIKYRHELTNSANITDISAETITYSQEDLMKLINNNPTAE